MKFSNLLKATVLSLFIAFALPATTNALDSNISVTALPADHFSDDKAVAKIVQRVYEIQSMDKTNLSSAEKKALRKELKELKAQATAANNGVYLSIGAVIVIILLLILLLK